MGGLFASLTAASWTFFCTENYADLIKCTDFAALDVWKSLGAIFPIGPLGSGPDPFRCSADRHTNTCGQTLMFSISLIECRCFGWSSFTGIVLLLFAVV